MKAGKSDLRVAIVASSFNRAVTERLLNGAHDGLAGAGVEPSATTLAWVPGAFELPLVAQHFARTGAYDAVICLGAVIRGDTDHNVHVAGQCAAGLQRVQLETGVPVMFGVLTTDNPQQAADRSGEGEGNRGFEAAVAAVAMARLMGRLREDGPSAASEPSLC